MGLREDVDDLKKVLVDKAVEEKKFKYPFGKKVSKAQRRKNYVTVLILYENGTCDFKKYQISDQTIMHDLIPRLATAGHVMFDKKGNPVIILPNWSVEPFSPLEHYQKTLIDGSNTKGFAILMNKMLKEQVNAKKPMSGILKWIIGLGLAGIIGYALISGGS